MPGLKMWICLFAEEGSCQRSGNLFVLAALKIFSIDLGVQVGFVYMDELYSSEIWAFSILVT